MLTMHPVQGSGPVLSMQWLSPEGGVTSPPSALVQPQNFQDAHVGVVHCDMVTNAPSGEVGIRRSGRPSARYQAKAACFGAQSS